MNLRLTLPLVSVALASSPAFAADHGMGLLIRAPGTGHPAVTLSYAPAAGVVMPPGVMLNYVNVPLVGDQGSYPSCVGWATGYYMKSYEEGAQREWVTTPANTSANHVFSPMYVYNQIQQPGGGSYIDDAFNLLATQGCDPLSIFNATDTATLPTAAQKSAALPFAIMSWNQVSLNPTSVKTVLMQGRPVVLGIAVFSQFESLAPGNDVYNSTAGTLFGYHAIAVIGYDDSKAGGAFYFINQWGTGWGDSGYGWLAYPMISNSAAVQNAYEAYNVVGPDGTAVATMTEGQIFDGTYRAGQWKFGNSLGETYILPYSNVTVHAASEIDVGPTTDPLGTVDLVVDMASNG